MLKISNSSAQGGAANKLRIDKIVDNLKINLMQKRADAPKVAPVNNSNNNEPPKPVFRTTLTDKRVHDLFIQAIQRLDPSESEQDDNDDDLTNLSWLTKFSLAKDMGLHNHYSFTLSPPPSPISSANSACSSTLSPVSPSLPLSVNTRAHRAASLTTKINPIYLNKPPGDEADGAGGLANTRSNIAPDISHIIKPWLPAASSSGCEMRARPPYSFSCLTFLAIESSERKRLSVKDIYAWIAAHFPYYSGVPSGSWKNSVRHNLSYNQCFAKVDKNLLAMRDFSGKGSLWCIDPEFRPLLIESLLKTPTHEQHKLANIPFLQDVSESPRAAASSSSMGPTKTIINPKMIALSKAKRLVRPPITPVRNSAPQVCSEMDAVSALLSMKCRASSTPICAGQRSDLSESNRKGRRKQILKPQKMLVDEAEDEDEEEEELSNLIDEEDELGLDEEESGQAHKRLLVRLPCFSRKAAQVSDDDDEEEEERSLQIDENFNSDNEESQSSKKRRLDEEDDGSGSDSGNSNALLELSRAASLVENQKNDGKSDGRKGKVSEAATSTRSTTRSMTNSSSSIEANVVKTRSKSLNLKTCRK
jgi:forkhead box protein N